MLEIGMLLFPKVTQLDLTGPFEVLRSLPGARVHTLGKTTEPVQSEGGLTLVPSTSYAEAPALDVVFVPGGAGQIPMTADPEVLAYLHRVGSAARWVSSACTGSLLLGAAGLLRGYRAATHWAFMELLPIVGAIPVEQRVVVDRNRITGGGVTAGIDIALTMVAEIAGREAAEMIQLQLEYDPQPPFASGHPRVAASSLVSRVRDNVRTRFDERRAQLEQIANSWS
jgi:cyclohexyl-isocyanide hydratase